MKVSRKSWHFRMYRFLISLWTEGPDVWKGYRTEHVPRDLCHYFWMIVLMVVTIPLWVGVAVIVLIIAALVIASMWVWKHGIVPPARRFDEWLDSKSSKRYARKMAKGPKQPSLIKTYVKAHKSKVCPIIEVIE